MSKLIIGIISALVGAGFVYICSDNATVRFYQPDLDAQMVGCKSAGLKDCHVEYWYEGPFLVGGEVIGYGQD